MRLFLLSARKLWKEWNLRVTVLFSVVLQIVLTTLGNRRKHNHKHWIRIVVWCVYVSRNIISTYALSIITNNVSYMYDEEGGSVDANTELTAFWAPFLLLHLGGPDTITAYTLEDNDLWLRQLAVQMGTAIYVFIMAWTGSNLSILSLFMFIAGLIKYGERTWVLRKASIETIRESMAHDGINLSFLEVTHFDQDKYSLFDAYQLVRTYFRPLLLNVRVPLVAHPILDMSTTVENGFKITEMALGFMYDNLYTKAPLLYTHWGFCLRGITFFLTLYVLMAFPVVIHDKHKFSNTDVTITRFLLAGAIILELYSAVFILSSDRFLVWLIERRKYSTEKALKCFLTQKRWSNNMSQFSLLSFIIKEKPLPCPNILKHLRLYKKLEKQWYAADMKIPNNLKTLICEYLQEKARGQIGPTNIIPVDLVDLNFTEELEKSILAWHVATDIRYELDGEDIKRQGRAFELHCGLICQISRYMFYLMVVHPNMISDGTINQIILQSILWAARYKKFSTNKIQAGQRFEQFMLTASEAYLHQRNFDHDQGDVANDIRIFLKNILPGLMRTLSEEMSLEERWKIISWTWLEMLPYAAIKCGGIQHAQHLKSGGEFLTHVWFLVTVVFKFTHNDFTPHPSSAPILFESLMPFLNRPDLFPDLFDIPEADTNPQV